MDEGDAPMPGVRSPQSSRINTALSLGVLADMAAAAGERIRHAVGRLLRLAFVAADHAVVEAVPVASDTRDARRRMDVRFRSDLGRPHRRNRMTGQTATVLRGVVKVEEVTVFAVEIGGLVFDEGGDGPLPVIWVRPVEDVPSASEPRGHAADLAGQLSVRDDYRVNRRYREIDLTVAGKRRLTEMADMAEDVGGVFSGARRREELVTQALTAREFYVVGKQYVIDDGKVKIVDEFTGRLMPDREWRDGLHQAVEAKESLEVNPPKATHARVSFQRFFRMYRNLAGMTGTALEARREFWQIYHLPVVVIPTNRPCVREHLPDRVFATDDAKWAAIVEQIKRINRAGQPMLVGTRSVRASEHLSGLLAKEELAHQVLNAVRHAEEAQIVAAAGQAGKITVATNMAGRGTNIKLGRGVADLGGLFVIASERHEAGRIDRQLFGRAGRQGEAGAAQALVSLEDELVRRHTPHLSATLRRRLGHTDGELTSCLARGLFDLAQRRAEKLALRQRKGVLRTDDWLDEYLGFAGREQ